MATVYLKVDENSTCTINFMWQFNERLSMMFVFPTKGKNSTNLPSAVWGFYAKMSRIAFVANEQFFPIFLRDLF